MNLKNSGPQLSPEEIAAFEDEIEGRLPDDYKRFLLASNGGMAEPSLGFHWNGELNEVPYFDALLPTSETNLRRGLRNLRKLGIDAYLPIASTLNHEDICLDFRNHIGEISIAFYSRVNDIPVAANLLFFASTFTDFLGKLFEISEEYCPIQELGEKGTPDDLASYLAEGNSIDSLSKNELSILCEAIKFDNMPLISACLERGPNLSRTIYIATVNQRPDIIRLLVEAGADVNEQDSYGERPLSYVGGTALPGEEGALNREVRDLLLSFGAIE